VRIARLTLDTTAVAAYALGSQDVGEVLRELSDEGARFAVPATCLVEAAMRLPDKAWPLLDVLIRLPHALTVSLDAEDWRRAASAAQLLGTPGRACAALLFARGQVEYVLTGEPEVYGEGVETIPIEG